MTTEYKIKTKHTEEVLLDFVRFTMAIRSPKATFRFCVMAFGCVLIATTMREYPIWVLGFGTLAALIVLFAFGRHKIGLWRLKRADVHYQNRTELEFIFGQSGFSIRNGEQEETVKKSYGELTSNYKDKRNYFLGLNGEEILILPFRDFTEGSFEIFETFISSKSHKAVLPTKIPFKQQLRNLNSTRKAAEEAHDRKIEAKQKAIREKKKKK